jgi:hypothetical protein
MGEVQSYGVCVFSLKGWSVLAGAWSEESSTSDTPGEYGNIQRRLKACSEPPNSSTPQNSPLPQFWTTPALQP